MMKLFCMCGGCLSCLQAQGYTPEDEWDNWDDGWEDYLPEEEDDNWEENEDDQCRFLS